MSTAYLAMVAMRKSELIKKCEDRGIVYATPKEGDNDYHFLLTDGENYLHVCADQDEMVYLFEQFGGNDVSEIIEVLKSIMGPIYSEYEDMYGQLMDEGWGEEHED